LKTRPFILESLLAALLVALLSGCAATSQRQSSNASPAVTGQAKRDGKPVKPQGDEVDEYATASVADPLEPLNRAIFWLNDQIYTFVVRPISKTYDTVFPGPVRTGVYNVFDNVDFPIRFVNDALQGNFKRAGQEGEKFLVNTVGGAGGIVRLSDRFPELCNVPAADTGQTFAKWGIGHGIYLVLPILGPKSLRDTVGLAGDYALDPVTWLTLYVNHAWTLAISCPDGVRTLHGKLSTYDAATHNTLDRYLAARTAYIQNRKHAALK